MLDINKESLSFLTQNMDINIKLCLDQAHPAGWSENRSKVDYDLWIVLEGNIKIIYQKTEHFLEPGDMFLIYPQKNYEAFNMSTANAPCAILFTHFDAVMGNNLRAMDEFSFDGKIPGKNLSGLCQAFLDSYANYKKGNTFSLLQLKGCFLSLLAHILEYQQENQCYDFTTTKNRDFSRLNPVLKYIENSTKKEITIKKLASIMGVSEKYFITFFKNTIGIPPQQYVIHKKMEKALQYLYEGSYTITEIAGMTGYEDLYAFSKAFKKIYGVSPAKIQ